jgi:hypothetical protein
MLTPNLRKWFLILLSVLWAFACSHLGIQSKKVDEARPWEETASAFIPDCQRNWSKGGGFVSSPVYTTWVKYDHLDFKKGFDLVIRTLQSSGH